MNADDPKYDEILDELDVIWKNFTEKELKMAEWKTRMMVMSEKQIKSKAARKTGTLDRLLASYRAATDVRVGKANVTAYLNAYHTIKETGVHHNVTYEHHLNGYKEFYDEAVALLTFHK